MSASASPSPVVSFGPFVFERQSRSLRRDGMPVRIGGRALDLLDMLLERPGAVLGRDELVTRVWPTTVVEETSLRVHMSALRRVLGESSDGSRYIANVPGRGYSFIGTVVAGAEPIPASQAPLPRLSHNLPPALTQPIGRDATIDTLRQQLAQRRLVSIVGAGGMGKTTVAIATAETVLATFPDGVRFVDLSSLADPVRVPSVVATTLGFALPDHASTPLVECLRHRRLLIVLDNCEHVIDAAADLAHALIAGTAGVHILTTSREPLNIAGEWIHRLQPLGLPAIGSPDDNAAPAVRLFLERASALDDSFALTPVTAPLVHQLCWQLDGLPLAIELAAARVDTLGLHELVNRLSEMFRVLTRGRRTAAPRHQTLQALLDWSHDLLSENDRVVLRRLSVFRGMFTLEAAAVVVECERIDHVAAMESLLSLVSKSLVTTDHAEGHLRYRLLSTTRTYALSKLMGCGEWAATSRRHAERLCLRLEQAEIERDEVDIEQLRDLLRYQAKLLDDLRSALDWAASPQGDARLGVLLAVATSKLIGQLGLMDEFRPRMQVALQQARSLQPAQPALEFRALAALCSCSALVCGTSPTAGEIFDRVAELAATAGSKTDRIEALYSGMCHAMSCSDYIGVARMSREVMALADSPDEPASVFLGERLLAQAHHALGRHREAEQLAARILSHPTRKAHYRYVGNIPTAVSLRVMRARIAWLTGRIDDAVGLAEEALRLAGDTNPFVLSHALALAAVPVALWRGDDQHALQLIRQLGELTEQNSQAYWASWARMCEAALLLRMGGAMEDLPQPLSFTTKEGDIAGTLDERLVTTEAVRRAREGEVGWSAPEILRADAEQQLALQLITPREAESRWLHALQLARSQDACSWELRIATSLARLWVNQDRRHEAGAVLEHALARMPQRAVTLDVERSNRMLASMQRSAALAIG